MRFKILTLSFICGWAATACAESKICTRAQAIEAEQQASDIHDWNRLYEAYKKYNQCDDAAIAEGFSDSVANLLANKWGEVKQASSMMESDVNYRKFILRHVDTLLTQQQFDAIQKNVSSCSSEMKKICDELRVRLDQVDAGVEKVKIKSHGE